MSLKTRTIQWMQSKILSELSKRQEITTYLALSAVVLRNVRSIEEQHNFDIALQYLLSKRLIKQQKDKDDFIVYILAA